MLGLSQFPSTPEIQFMGFLIQAHIITGISQRSKFVTNSIMQNKNPLILFSEPSYRCGRKVCNIAEIMPSMAFGRTHSSSLGLFANNLKNVAHHLFSCHFEIS